MQNVLVLDVAASEQAAAASAAAPAARRRSCCASTAAKARSSRSRPTTARSGSSCGPLNGKDIDRRIARDARVAAARRAGRQRRRERAMNTDAIDILVIHDGGSTRRSSARCCRRPASSTSSAIFDGLGHHMPAADVLVVACGVYGEEAGSLIREGVEDVPDRPVVLVTQGAPNGYVDHAFQAGVADLVVLPAAVRRRPGPRDVAPGPVHARQGRRQARRGAARGRGQDGRRSSARRAAAARR